MSRSPAFFRFHLGPGRFEVLDEPMATKRALLIGVGNEYAHDDAAGLMVAREIKRTAPENIEVIECGGEGAALMENWRGAAQAIVIDATSSGAVPGTVRRFDARRGPLPAQPFRASSHAFGLYEAVELARSLCQLPDQLIVFGIEGRDFTAGVGLSPGVDQAARQLARAVLDELRKLTEDGNPRAE